MRTLRQIFRCGLVALALLALNLAGPIPNVLAQSIPTVRDIAQTGFLEGRANDLQDKFVLAEVAYEGVFRMDDPDKEFPDIRADAGLYLAMILVREKKWDRAIQWCHKVIDMKDAPEGRKENGRVLLKKLEEVKQRQRKQNNPN